MNFHENTSKEAEFSHGDGQTDGRKERQTWRS